MAMTIQAERGRSVSGESFERVAAGDLVCVFPAVEK